MDLPSPKSSMSSDHEVSSPPKRQSDSKNSFTLPSVQSSSPSSMLLSLLPCNMFFTGYLDCSLEALKYLLEVEGLPMDHPLVYGLQCQLYDTYRLLQLQHQFDTHFQVNTANENKCENIKASDDSLGEHTKQADDPTDQTAMLNYNVTESGLKSKESGEAVHIDAADSEISEKLQASGLSAEAQEVAVALAEQIYLMLNGDDAEEESDIESVDEESIDEGFEEITGTI